MRTASPASKQESKIVFSDPPAMCRKTARAWASWQGGKRTILHEGGGDWEVRALGASGCRNAGLWVWGVRLLAKGF